MRWTICSGKYQFWQIIILEVYFSKIFPQQILHIEMRAKRVVTIFTARLALKATEKRKRKCFWALKMAPVPTYLENILNLQTDILRKTRAKRAVHCPFGSNFCTNIKITVSICALDVYTQYLSDCQKSLYSFMLGRKTRAKRAVRFFTTRLALVFFRGILVAFSL